MENKHLWTRNAIQLLIAHLKAREYLYKKTHVKYTNTEHRETALSDICEELKLLNPNMTVVAVKAKIRSLRAQYIRQSRILQSQKKEAETKDPTLWCFDQLHFLAPYIKTKQSKSSDGVSTIDISDESENSPDESTLSSSHGKRKNDSSDMAVEAQQNEQNRDNWNWLGEQVVSQINEIRHPTLRGDTVWAIQCLLREAMIKDTLLTNN